MWPHFPSYFCVCWVRMKAVLRHTSWSATWNLQLREYFFPTLRCLDSSRRQRQKKVRGTLGNWALSLSPSTFQLGTFYKQYLWWKEASWSLLLATIKWFNFWVKQVIDCLKIKQVVDCFHQNFWEYPQVLQLEIDITWSQVEQLATIHLYAWSEIEMTFSLSL